MKTEMDKMLKKTQIWQDERGTVRAPSVKNTNLPSGVKNKH